MSLQNLARSLIEKANAENLLHTLQYQIFKVVNTWGRCDHGSRLGLHTPCRRSLRSTTAQVRHPRNHKFRESLNPNPYTDLFDNLMIRRPLRLQPLKLPPQQSHIHY